MTATGDWVDGEAEDLMTLADGVDRDDPVEIEPLADRRSQEGRLLLLRRCHL